MRPVFSTLGTVIVLAIVASQNARGQYASFTQSTDTISVAGKTALSGQATFEAIVSTSTLNYPAHPPADLSAVGDIFTSIENSAADQRFGIYNGGGVYGYAYPVGLPNGPFVAGTVATNTWYNLSYVYDGSQERIYINGSLVGSRSSGGGIGSGTSPTVGVGAVFAAVVLRPSFLGNLQSFRISNSARYAGNSYSANLNSFTSDANTILLYNFDTLTPGSTSIMDLSGNGHTGTFGVGFTGATSPTIVPEPAALLPGLILVALWRRRGPVRKDSAQSHMSVGCGRPMWIGFSASVVAIASFASAASAQVYQWPVSDGGNGHYYEFVPQQLTWTQANAAAQLRTFNGVNGYLATDTSAAENAFLASKYVVDGQGNLTPGWLGAYQDTSAPDFSEPAGGWRWVTGEPWSYTNWFPGLPDNSGGNQNYIRTQTFFRWDDFQDVSSNFTPGYYVEYAPEPAILFPACLSLVFLRRIRTDLPAAAPASKTGFAMLP